jgi:diguanylate cyclase (GGDEF)-like protein
MKFKKVLAVALWRRGMILEWLAILGAALLVWWQAVEHEAFEALYEFSQLHDEWELDELFVLGVCLSLAFLVMVARRSLQLQREVTGRKVAERAAHSLARHDVLTGLPNRRVFAEEIKTAIKKTAAGQTSYAVLLIDLDRFKPVNDIHGHATGDLVLEEIATRLREVAGKQLVARLGGDEFAMIVDCSVPDASMRSAKRLLKALSEPIMIGELPIEVGASIGIALCRADGSDPEEILRAADIAMYRAKREGRSTFRFFEQSMDEELRQRAAIETDLRRALPAGEIVPYYQPLMDLQANRLIGFEVLARWAHPTKGVLPPSDFITLAEETGLIGDMTYRLLRKACTDAQLWPQHVTLAVNVSPVQLKDRWFPQRVLAILSETGFAPGRLEIEITESALATDLDTVRSVLASLQNVGVRVALDDFGTGYSSLYHLRELHFDKIKIDRSFVQSLHENAESPKIEQAIVSLGKSLGMPTTAEGIEDVEKLEHLKQLGCETGQGYLFSVPLPAALAATLLHVQPDPEPKPVPEKDAAAA